MIYYAVTAGGHTTNGQLIKFEQQRFVDLDDAKIETNKGVIYYNDPTFVSFESFQQYYGESAEWYQKLLKRAQVNRDHTIELAEQAWSVLQQIALPAEVVGITKDPLAKEKIAMASKKASATKAKKEAPDTGMDQQELPKDGKKARQVADRKVITVKKLRDYDKDTDGKLAVQAQGILKSLDDLGGSADKQELLTKMSEHVQSVQSMAKIFQHYRAKMIELGLISVDEGEKVKTEDVKAAA